LGGITTGGIIPIGLALLGDLFPYEERGRALGWMFGSIAGGMAFGSSLGPFLNPLIGWRAEFMILAGISAIVLGFAIRQRHDLEGKRSKDPLSPGKILGGYVSLFTNARAAKGYLYIFCNGVFHSGIFSWLGLYFAERHHLGDQGIGLALLGYGVPGMLLGPAIGRMADRVGRKRLIPLGLLVGALAGAALIPRTPLGWPVLIATVLSLGYDMSHPLLAGIITSVTPARRGLAMGMNAFVLFTGFGLGALAFEALLQAGFTTALAVFSGVQLVLGLLAIPLFCHEDSAAGDHSGTLAGKQ
jgi:predicted MFS family arabinose efflux permease